MQLQNWVFDTLKNKINQKVNDIKDRIFSVVLFFIGLFSFGQGAYKAVIIKETIAKIM